MKRILKSSLSLLLAITIIFSSAYIGLSEGDFSGLFAVEAHAASESDLTFTLNKDGQSYSVDSCDTAASGEIVIPDIYDRLPVTGIRSCAFYGCENLTNIIIPEKVTHIEDYAFTGCKSLDSIAIPNGVTSLGWGAFSSCTSLESIIIPNSVTTIAVEAFDGCTSLTSVTIPDSVTNIERHAFASCTSLESIIIPEKVTRIGDYAFTGCKSLTSIAIPNGVTSLGWGAFASCTSLESIIIPNSVTTIGRHAFADCRNLSDVYYNSSALSWNNMSIGEGNEYLINANIHCIDGILNIDDNLTFTLNDDGESYSVTDCDTSVSGALIIPDTYNSLPVTNIDMYAFDSCVNLTSITFPENLKSWNFGWGLSGCKNLSDIFVSEGNEFFCSVDGVLFNKQMTEILRFPRGKKANEYMIPDSVTLIKDAAFFLCENITSITIPDSVTEIEIEAFECCTNLTSVLIGNNVKVLGWGAFAGCKNLTSIIIPDSVTSIGECAFNVCTNLKYVFFTGSQSKWAGITIDDYNETLTNVAIHYNSTEHKYNEVVDIEATCTNNGLKHQECSVCGYSLENEVVSAFGHEYSTEWTIDIMPTCTMDGSKSYHCLKCDEKFDVTNISAPGHTYSTEWTIDVEPTCTVDGSKSHHCIVCGDKKGIAIVEATGHSYGDWVVTKENTCTEEGSHSKTCSACGDVITETIGAFGHNFSNEWTIDIEPTCTTDGSKSHHCIACEDKTDETTIEAQGHNYTWMHNYEEKTKTGICSNCSEEKTDELLVTDVLTFTLNGDGASYTVTDCEFGYIGNMEIPSTYKGLPVIAIGTDAFRDCTAITSVVIPDSVKSIGGSAFRNCTNLTEIRLSDNISNIPGAMLFGCKNLKSIIIPDNVKRVDAYAFSGCSALEYVFYENDEVEWTKVTIRGNNAPLTDAAIHFNSIGEHTYSAEWSIDIAPTCTVDGSKSRHCTGCELKTDITTIEAPGHNYSSEWTIDIVATCTEDGSKSHHCTICGDKTDITVIEAIGHNYVVAGTSFIHPHTVTCECLFCEDVKTESSAVLDCVECNFTINTIDSSSYKLVSYNGTESNVEIPSIYNGRAITTIANACFRGNTSIISIDISDGVTTIGSLAFMNCTSLKKVYIPASVTSIGANAFYGFAGIIYCTNGSFAHQYAIDNNFNYVLLSIQETENTQIDYVNLIIRTTVQSCADIEKILGISETAMAIPIASHMHGNLEYYGTGTIISVFDSNDYIGDYTLIVNGDTNGDSVCDVLDCAQVELASNGNADLLGAYAEAGDTNGDGVIDITDYQSIVNKAVS